MGNLNKALAEPPQHIKWSGYTALNSVGGAYFARRAEGDIVSVCKNSHRCDAKPDQTEHLLTNTSGARCPAQQRESFSLYQCWYWTARTRSCEPQCLMRPGQSRAGPIGAASLAAGAFRRLGEPFPAFKSWSQPRFSGLWMSSLE